MGTKLQEIAYNQVANISEKGKNKIKKTDIFESIFKSLGKELNIKKDKILILNAEDKNIKKDKKEIYKKVDTNKDILKNSTNLEIVNFSLKIQYDEHIKKKENKSQNITNLNQKSDFNNQGNVNNKIFYSFNYINRKILDLKEYSIKEDIKASKKDNMLAQTFYDFNYTYSKNLDNKKEFIKDDIKLSYNAENIAQNLEEVLHKINKPISQNTLEISQNLPKEQITLNRLKNINNKQEINLNTNLYVNKNIDIKKSSLKQELDSKSSKIQENEKHNNQNNNFVNTIDLKDVFKNIENKNMENKQENSYLLSNLQQSDNKIKEDVKTINNIDNKDKLSILDKLANINTLIELKEGYESNNNYNQQKDNTGNFTNKMFSNQNNFNFSYNQTNITANIVQNTLNMLINTKDIVVDYNIISEIQNILEKNGFRNSNLVIKDKEKLIKIYKDEFRDSKNHGLNIEV